jgi:hypothetical protein
VQMGLAKAIEYFRNVSLLPCPHNIYLLCSGISLWLLLWRMAVLVDEW